MLVPPVIFPPVGAAGHRYNYLNRVPSRDHYRAAGEASVLPDRLRYCPPTRPDRAAAGAGDADRSAGLELVPPRGPEGDDRAGGGRVGVAVSVLAHRVAERGGVRWCGRDFAGGALFIAVKQ